MNIIVMKAHNITRVQKLIHVHKHAYIFRLGEVCSHVAALLFKVEACVRLGYTNPACTSTPCEWNQAFSKKV